MAQLNRMELQSKEYVQRIDINYKSEVENLETRVQKLERADQSANQMPADQMPGSHQMPESHQIPCDHHNIITQMVSSRILEH